MEDLKQRKKNLIMFPLGTVGRDMIYYLFTSCIITFVLFTRNLTNAQFGAITAIVVAARIFDALNDPIMGNIIERTRTKWGKFKPAILVGGVVSVIFYLILFGNVGTGNKGFAACTGQHDNTHRCVIGSVLKRGVQRIQCGGVEGIQLVGTVDADRADAVVGFNEKYVVGHNEIHCDGGKGTLAAFCSHMSCPR